MSTYEGHLQIIQALLQAGADVKHKNKKGQTVLALVTNSIENELVVDDNFVDMLIGPANDDVKPIEPDFIPNVQETAEVAPSEKQKIMALLKSAGAKE